MDIVPHTPAWYDRLATQQEGYHYPWRSRLPAHHGEDAYHELVLQHLKPDADVLDVACGHGDTALEIAPRCRSVLGYDRMDQWIAMAQQRAAERHVTNARFICHDSSLAANGGHARLPGADDSFDFLICSKGPFHWVEDAPRVARPGAVLLMLVPDARPAAPWNDWLPEALRMHFFPKPGWARNSIEARLAKAQLALHSWWSFDVPELFPAPEQFYIWRAWGCADNEVPPYEKVRPVLERIFAEFGGESGLVVRYRRYLWKAIVPG